jgi:hypothetical protein
MLGWPRQKKNKKGTVRFYQESYQKLLDYGPWADCRLDEIDEPKIEAFKIWALSVAAERETGNGPLSQRRQ